MTREPETPEDVRQAADLAESDPPPVDDETRLARDSAEPADAAEDESEEQRVVEQISAERGAD